MAGTKPSKAQTQRDGGTSTTEHERSNPPIIAARPPAKSALPTEAASSRAAAMLGLLLVGLCALLAGGLTWKLGVSLLGRLLGSKFIGDKPPLPPCRIQYGYVLQGRQERCTIQVTNAEARESAPAGGTE